MKVSAIVIGFVIVLVIGCSTSTKLLPAEPRAQVSFEGQTQAGKQEHHLEVRRLAYYDPEQGKMVVSDAQYVVYVAGSYGPEILKKIDGASVLVKRASDNIVEIYYIAGAHTHVRQRWKLLGYTAELLQEEDIEWNQTPKE
jgi:hypothetical protein